MPSAGVVRPTAELVKTNATLLQPVMPQRAPSMTITSTSSVQGIEKHYVKTVPAASPAAKASAPIHIAGRPLAPAVSSGVAAPPAIPGPARIDAVVTNSAVTPVVFTGGLKSMTPVTKVCQRVDLTNWAIFDSISLLLLMNGQFQFPSGISSILLSTDRVSFNFLLLWRAHYLYLKINLINANYHKIVIQKMKTERFAGDRRTVAANVGDGSGFQGTGAGRSFGQPRPSGGDFDAGPGRLGQRRRDAGHRAHLPADDGAGVAFAVGAAARQSVGAVDGAGRGRQRIRRRRHVDAGRRTDVDVAGADRVVLPAPDAVGGAPNGRRRRLGRCQRRGQDGHVAQAEHLAQTRLRRVPVISSILDDLRFC